MTSFEQQPFGAGEFADNPEPRCACLLLLDTSGSMSGRPIEELNAGLIAFKDELMADAMASKRVEVGIVTFGPVQVVSEFQTPDMFHPPVLRASGDTPMGAAIQQGLDQLRARKSVYQANGVQYFRPWVFMITDGGPTDSWQAAAAAIREGESSKSFMFFSVGVENADFEKLKQISVREPLRLQGLRFRDLFAWLSNSLRAVSQSKVGDEVPLQSPVTPKGWATTA